MKLLKDWSRVMVNQWSWKNDRISLVLNALIALFITYVYCTVGILDTSTLPEHVVFKALFLFWAIFTIMLIATYHTLKFITMGLVFMFVVYYKSKGIDKAEDFYTEALTWRK